MHDIYRERCKSFGNCDKENFNWTKLWCNDLRLITLDITLTQQTIPQCLALVYYILLAAVHCNTD
jgi:hypothetical protein